MIGVKCWTRGLTHARILSKICLLPLHRIWLLPRATDLGIAVDYTEWGHTIEIVLAVVVHIHMEKIDLPT